MDALGYTPEDFVLDENDPNSYYKLDELFEAVQAAYPEMTVLGSNGYLGGIPAGMGSTPLGMLSAFWKILASRILL